MILQSLAGLPAFLVYFCTAIVAVVAYLFVYTRVTPHDEFQLIRENDPAAAIALASHSNAAGKPPPAASHASAAPAVSAASVPALSRARR